MFFYTHFSGCVCYLYQTRTLSMQKHTSYLMTGIITDPKRRKWTSVPGNVQGLLQIGSRFGVLILDVLCECCNNLDTHTYFFTMDEEDHVSTKWLRPRTLDDDVVIMLPNAKGRFSPRITSVAGFDDSYILTMLVFSMSDDQDDNRSVDLVFTRIRNTIRLRTAFRNLYFRAFRRSFAPDQPQGRRTIMQYAEDFMEHSLL